MSDKSSLQQKALEINLDPAVYGTIAEIGAGQEVARCFFQAGGAAGTIAKTMSAYDMQFSDAIYGAEEDGRYVSRSRVEKMLRREFDLLLERLGASRPKNTTFFVFADSVAAQGFKKRDNCHGWLGVRLQLYPQAPPSEIIVHVRMLDESNRQQQEALGIIGVNLIYGAYYYYRNPVQLIESLNDFLGVKRLEVDMIHFSGPYFEEVDNRLMALQLVKSGLTNAVLFTPPGTVVQPAEALYKKEILVYRGSFRPVTHVSMDMVRCGMRTFLEEPNLNPDQSMLLAEITMAKLMTGGDIDTKDFLARVDILSSLGFNVLISNYGRFFRLRAYLNQFTGRRIGIVLGVDNIVDIFNEQYYEELEGGILEAFGKLFPGNTKLYVYPKLVENGPLATADNVVLPAHLRHLYAHLRENGFIVPLTGHDESVMAHFSRTILEDLKRGDGDWRLGVPEPVYQAIVAHRLFGYDSI
ncbi:MAG: TonB-dependent receptor [Candidatus Hydrogenedentes bacterium]|nr:TonB-dependent receptor [Candidatus Hydrogenedentota bacterium]